MILGINYQAGHRKTCHSNAHRMILSWILILHPCCCYPTDVVDMNFWTTCPIIMAFCQSNSLISAILLSVCTINILSIKHQWQLQQTTIFCDTFLYFWRKYCFIFHGNHMIHMKYIHIIIIVTWSGVLYHIEWMRSYHRITRRNVCLYVSFPDVTSSCFCLWFHAWNLRYG